MAANAGATAAGSPRISWFPLETDLLTDDDKVFDLMDGATDDGAFADFGRYVALISRVYREGPALQVGRRMARRVAHDLGLGLDGFERFVSRCVDAGLLSRRLWDDERVITSHGIQLRWIKAKGRSKSQGLPAEFSRWDLLDEGEDPDEPWAVPQGAEPGFDGPPTCQRRDEAECDRLKTPERFSSVENQAMLKSDALKTPESSPLDKIRLDKTRQEEKREDQSVSPSCHRQSPDNANDARPTPDVSQLVPTCMAREEDGKVFADSLDQPHRTRYGALEATYRERTGRGDFDGLMRRACELCPGGCRASPADVSECFELMIGALERVDPGKGSPWALVRHVLVNDRGGRDAA